MWMCGLAPRKSRVRIQTEFHAFTIVQWVKWQFCSRGWQLVYEKDNSKPNVRLEGYTIYSHWKHYEFLNCYTGFVDSMVSTEVELRKSFSCYRCSNPGKKQDFEWRFSRQSSSLHLKDDTLWQIKLKQSISNWYTSWQNERVLMN